MRRHELNCHGRSALPGSGSQQSAAAVWRDCTFSRLTGSVFRYRWMDLVMEVSELRYCSVACRDVTFVTVYTSSCVTRVQK